MNYDGVHSDEKLDAILAFALQGDEQPSADFSRRVMEAVSQTRQERPASRRKIWTSLAACAAVLLVALPLVRLSTLRMGAVKSADDCATQECVTGAGLNGADGADDYDAEDGNAYNQFTLPPEETKKVPDRDNSGSLLLQEQTPDKNEKQTEDPVVLTGKGRCAAVRNWLEENGVAATAEDPAAYVLTAEQAAALQAALPQWDLPDGACTIRLEE